MSSSGVDSRLPQIYSFSAPLIESPDPDVDSSSLESKGKQRDKKLVELMSIAHKDDSKTKAKLTSKNIFEYNRRLTEVSPEELQEKLDKEFDRAQKYLDDCAVPFSFWKEADPKGYAGQCDCVKLHDTSSQGLGEGAAASLIGTRPEMEDTFTSSIIRIKINSEESLEIPYYGIFDGHGGGPDCAKFLEKNSSAYLKHVLTRELEKGKPLNNKTICDVLKVAFVHLGAQYIAEMNSKNCCYPCFKSDRNDGTNPKSAALSVLKIQDTLFVANAGDCRAVLVRSDGSVVALSNDAKPDKEEFKKGIIIRGGQIREATEYDVARVISKSGSELAMARAVGHPEENSGISPRACIIAYPCSQLPEGDNFLILATDGLWEMVSSNGVGKTVMEISQRYQKQHLDDQKQQHSQDSLTETIAKELAKKAFQILPSKCDNTAVMVVKISRPAAD